ncbi:uncharacterized protein LOC144118415 [Amblyomma americanum]
MMSYASAIGCLILAAPPVVIGAISRNTNFTSAGYPGPSDLRPEDQPSVLPFALRYLCPNVISVMGMTAIIGAVLSSADSSALSASTLITRNVYQIIYRPTATDQEMAKVLRCVVCMASAAATSVALFATSVFALWTLSTEMVYVVLFPQLLCVFYLPQRTNSYGCIVGFVLGTVVRLLCGEPSIGLPALLQLPMYDQDYGQRFPFRTLCTIISLVSLVLGSAVAEVLFSKGWLRRGLDVCHCFHETPTSTEHVVISSMHVSSRAITPTRASCRSVVAAGADTASIIKPASRNSVTIVDGIRLLNSERSRKPSTSAPSSLRAPSQDPVPRPSALRSGARKATDISRGPEPTSMTPATASEVVRPRPEDLPVASVGNRHESAELDETRPNRASPLLIGRPPSLVGESPQISTTLTGREILSVLTRTSSEDISDAAAAVQRSADNQVKSDVLSGFSKQDDASRHKKCEVTTTGEQGGESSVTDRNIDGAENAATSSVSLTTLSSAQAEISSTSSATEDRTQDKKRRSKKQARSERPKKPKKRQQH